jgi:hypothetical protein
VESDITVDVHGSHDGTKLTKVLDVYLATVGLRDAAADALHTLLDEVLRLRGECARSADDLHAVGDNVVAVSSLDGAAGNHAALERVLQA